jgi:hypothetical protein
MNSPRFFLLIAIFFSLTAHAKIWRVDSNTGNAADFRTLQAANDNGSVVDGDTLYVSGSPVAYGNLTLSKRLVIIGPGYFLAENDSTQALPNAASAGTITFNQTTSNGSVMMGISASTITINGSNIIFRRNYSNSVVYIGLNNAVSNVTVAQNYVYYIYLGNSSNTNIVVSNNIVYYYLYNTSGASATIVNNIFNIGQTSSALDCDNSVVQNNIVWFAGIAGENNTYQNNMDSNTGGGTAFPAGNGNVQDQDMNLVFLLTGSTDGKWRLKTDSPAIGTGTNNYDMGAYGGPSPYVRSGIPPIPAIFNVVAPVFGTGAQGLQVQVKAKGRN